MIHALSLKCSLVNKKIEYLYSTVKVLDYCTYTKSLVHAA